VKTLAYLRYANLPIVIASVAIGLSGCGGSGTAADGAATSAQVGSATGPGGSSAPIGVSSAPVTPTPPDPAHDPLPTSQPIPYQHAVLLHPFSIDFTQGGTTFTDPDHHGLTYAVTFGHVYNPYSDPNPPTDFQVQGTRIVGTPQNAEPVVVTVTATDWAGNTADVQFTINVAPDSPPVVTNGNDLVVAAVGSSVNYDPIKGGTLFSDADGDPLTYTVSIRGSVGGLAVSGTHVTGVLQSPGAVVVTVTADDGFGGTASNEFAIVAPAPEPGRPTLPSATAQYADAELNLPFVFTTPTALALLRDTAADNPVTDAGATLGRVLFFDKRLSGSNTVACASCHEHDRAFTSSTTFGAGAAGIPAKHKVMTLANVRYDIQHAWFSVMSETSLEDLPLKPLQNPEELASSIPLVVQKLAATDFYPPLFQAAFGTPDITSDRIGTAIAQFLRAMISYRTKYDLANNPPFNGPGDPASVLDAAELRGMQIFNGASGISCANCHEPYVQSNSWQANNGLDVLPTDGAAFSALTRGNNLGVFRAASLRNIALTAPYMHDGRFATLRDVIDHYDHGVVTSPYTDSRLEYSDGTVIQMNLSDADKDALEAFLNTLTDSVFLSDPKFMDPFQ
jgi:cytochrome c peroxidase